MKKWLALIIALSAGGAVALFLVFYGHPEDKVYHGKSLKVWALQLCSADARLRDEATQIFQIVGSNAVPGLVKLLGAQDSLVRRQIWAVVPRTPKPVQSFLATCVRRPNAAQFHVAAARALRVLGPQAAPALAPLTRVFLANELGGRWEAAGTLAAIGPAGIHELTNALASGELNLRYAAVSGLGSAQSEAALAAAGLIPVLTDAELKDRAAIALAGLSPGSFPSVAETLRSGDKALRLRLEQILPSLRLPRDLLLQEVLVMFADHSSEQRIAALRILSSLGLPNRKMLDTCITALQDPVTEIRVTATTALTQPHWQTPRAVEALMRSLRDESPLVSEKAARALGLIGAPARTALPELRRLAQSSDSPAHQAALDAADQISKCVDEELAAKH